MVAQAYPSGPAVLSLLRNLLEAEDLGYRV